MSSSTSSLAARKVGSNQDLLIQIITRLPVKSVLRFKSLSTTWLGLITEVDQQLRSRTSLDPVRGIFLRMIKSVEEKNIYFSDRKVKYKHQYVPLNPINNRPMTNEYSQAPRGPSADKFIIQSSNGLFLLWNRQSAQLNVYNPTTLSYTAITNQPRKGENVSATLAFDPLTSIHYKLILAAAKISWDSPYEIYIYSSKTRAWSGRFKITKTDGGSSVLSTQGVYWNGSVHWISATLKKTYPRDEKTDSLRFHVDTQTAHKIPEPQKRASYTFKCNHYFGETCGHLYYIDSGVENSIHIQEMKADYSGWFVKYRVNLSKVIKELSNRVRTFPVNNHGYDIETKYCDFDFLSVIQFGDEKAALLLWVNNTVISCNLVNHKFKTLAEFTDGYEPGPGLLPKNKHANGFLQPPSFSVSDSGFPFIPSLSDT